MQWTPKALLGTTAPGASARAKAVAEPDPEEVAAVQKVWVAVAPGQGKGNRAWVVAEPVQEEVGTRAALGDSHRAALADSRFRGEADSHRAALADSHRAALADSHRAALADSHRAALADSHRAALADSRFREEADSRANLLQVDSRRSPKLSRQGPQVHGRCSHPATGSTRR
jgi:hypothetical protein